MKANRLGSLVVVVAILVGVSGVRAAPLGTGFTYQGQLKESGSPANGIFDLEFRLFDADVAGNQIGNPVVLNGVVVVNGLFTVQLNVSGEYGVSAFNGAARWLESTVNGQPLAPRQALTPAPHAIRAVSGVGGPMALNVTATGEVGIGTDTPLANLHVAGETGALRLDANDDAASYLLLDDRQPTQAKISKFNSAGTVLLDVNPMPLDGVSNGVVRFFRETNTTGLKRVDFFRGNNTTGTSASIGVDGSNSYFQLQGGNVGIGTATPLANLHVVGGIRASGGSLTVTNVTNEAASVSLNFAEDVARIRIGGNGAGSTNGLDIQRTGDVSLMRILHNGNVGIGTAAPAAKLHVVEGAGPALLADGNILARGTTEIDSLPIVGIVGGYVVMDSRDPLFIRLLLDPDDIQGSKQGFFGNDGPSDIWLNRRGGDVAIGDVSAPGAKLHVEKNSTVAVFDRTGSDGTIIQFRQAGVTEGTISVAGTTVSYNAFTGSHYGWIDESLQRGTVVVMTGENRHRDGHDHGEPIYGVAPSKVANDPRCMGSYLGLLQPHEPASPENPYLIMAVGNGDMRVVDTRRNIEPGDYLISSDVPGHAMLDDVARFPVGYVVARAAERVDWSDVTDTVEGRKHKRISVFFESFERGSATGLGKIVEQQQARIDELSQRLNELEAAKHTQSSLAAAGILCFGLGAATFGGHALRRRSAKGRFLEAGADASALGFFERKSK